MKNYLLFTLLTFGLLIIGCGSKGGPDLSPEASRKTIKTAPDWYLSPPSKEGFIGQATTATSQDMQMATDKARTAAATALAGWVTATADGSKVKLPAPFYDAVCPSFESLTDYLTDLAANIEKISLSGDNTKAITNAKTSTDTLMKTIGCF